MAHLLVVYLVAGSNFLAVRLGVQMGSGFPPLTMMSIRFLLAGTLIWLWSWRRGEHSTPSRSEAAWAVLPGLLMWGLGNGLASSASQWAGAGLVAICFATTPLWVAAYECIWDRTIPPVRLLTALLLGFAGTAVLVLSSSSTASGVLVLGPATLAALALAPAGFAGGILVQRRRPACIGLLAATSYQMLAGAIALGLAAALKGEPMPNPTMQALIALVYLVLIGGVVGMTSFMAASRLLPTSIFMTQAYVNPTVSLLLGAALLGEPLTLSMLAGGALVLVGVYGMFSGALPHAVGRTEAAIQGTEST